MNQIIDKVREGVFEVLHFMDDDVKFTSGSLIKNVQALQENRSDEPLLVGSHFQPNPKSLENFKNNSTDKYLPYEEKFFHHIFSMPFEYEYTFPFVSGQSLAGFVKQLPHIPQDKSGITDDAFISDYFSIKGENNTKHHSIIKPNESVVFFDVSSKPKEWVKQQVRILAGVLRALDSFGPEKLIAVKNLHFPMTKPYPFDVNKLDPKDVKRLYWFNALNSLVTKQTMKKLQNSEEVAWGTATSTKPVTSAQLSNQHTN